MHHGCMLKVITCRRTAPADRQSQKPTNHKDSLLHKALTPGVQIQLVCNLLNTQCDVCMLYLYLYFCFVLRLRWVYVGCTQVQDFHFINKKSGNGILNNTSNKVFAPNCVCVWGGGGVIIKRYSTSYTENWECLVSDKHFSSVYKTHRRTFISANPVLFVYIVIM